MSYYSRYYRRNPYWEKIHSYLTGCCKCGGTTSKKFARTHDGMCKRCATGIVDATFSTAVPVTATI